MENAVWIVWYEDENVVTIDSVFVHSRDAVRRAEILKKLGYDDVDIAGMPVGYTPNVGRNE